MKKISLAAATALITLLSSLSLALASDPGVGNSPEPRVPQGPNNVACLNQGGLLNPAGMGVPNAIASGGAVHCEHGPHTLP